LEEKEEERRRRRWWVEEEEGMREGEEVKRRRREEDILTHPHSHNHNHTHILSLSLERFSPMIVVDETVMLWSYIEAATKSHRCRISATSAFLLASSPSLLPEDRCELTKQRGVSWTKSRAQTAPVYHEREERMK
jgi:hypothetical protein